MQEKGQRTTCKHINNFSELLLTNIRRSTSKYNSIKHPSIIEIINPNTDKNSTIIKTRNVVLLLLQTTSTNKEKFLLSSENNLHFTSIQHCHI